MIDGPFIVPVALFVMVGAVTIFFPIARAFARRLEGDARRQALPPEVLARLERMEQSIDSIAVEVERISEGQRFTTKLLSERAEPRAVDAPRSAG